MFLIRVGNNNCHLRASWYQALSCIISFSPLKKPVIMGTVTPTVQMKKLRHRVVT